MKKLYSAAEIVEMGIPALPKTKARLIDRAKAEGWYFEERKGLGGKRREYELPPQYQMILNLRGLSAAPHRDTPSGVPGGGLGVAEPGSPYVLPEKPSEGSAPASIAGGRIADPDLLTVAIRAFEEWAAARNLVVAPDRKAAIIAVLYDYLARGAGEKEVRTFLQVVG